MKILWLTTKDRKSFGHTELFGLSESLIKKGHEVTVIMRSQDKHKKAGYIEYVRNPGRKFMKLKVKMAFLVPWWVMCKRPDYILVEWQCAFIPIILLILSKLRIYKNTLVHDIRTIAIPSKQFKKQRLFNACVNISNRHFLGVTTINPAIKSKICSEYNIPPEKVGVWSSGVDLNLFYPRDGVEKRKELGLDGKFVVFYHGSVGTRRGVVELVEAFRILRNDTIHLFILGSGLEMERIRKIKETEGLENVHIHAPVEYKEVPYYIAISDICIVPLPDEECWRVSSPLKVMEYLAMGKPMIVTDIRAHREIIPNPDDAFFMEDIKRETLAAAITNAYDRREELYRMSEASLRNAKENCSWDIQAEKLVKYLHNLVQEK